MPPIAMNVGTFALSVYVSAIKTLCGPQRPLPESLKHYLLTLLKMFVFGRMAFHTGETMHQLIQECGSSKIRFQEIPIGLEPYNYQIIGDGGVFTNLVREILKNATSFAKTRVWIYMFIYPEDSPSILILDDGPGIGKKDLSRLFDTGHSGRPDQGGEGLGLTTDKLESYTTMGMELYIRTRRRTWHQCEFDPKTKQIAWQALPAAGLGPKLKEIKKTIDADTSRDKRSGAAFLLI